jgi:Protein of unknown function, DUF547
VEMRAILAVVGLSAILAAPAAAQMDYQPPPDLEPLYRPYDQLLDAYNRDGIFYYRELRQDKAKLDRYLDSLNTPAVAADLSKWDKPRQIAFWVNAYNAFSLETTVAHYPARINQVPGAFAQLKHAAAGKTVTLDEIENTILAGYNDPRIYLVLGRGAMGSGRLRSEAFSGPRLEEQLAQSAQQFATRPEHVRVDQMAGTLAVSPIFSWRAKAFIDAYADKSPDLPGRTPIELAIVGFLKPYLLKAEREFLEKNTWKLVYMDFDWKLNDRVGLRH